jgi:NAD(P)-dependent dehydrogenase (short-subunit alcohol dehydrogenase family)
MRHDLQPPAPRTYVITGTASRIELGAKAHFEAAGERVIGVDVRDAEVIACAGVAYNAGASWSFASEP